MYDNDSDYSVLSNFANEDIVTCLIVSGRTIFSNFVIHGLKSMAEL